MDFSCCASQFSLQDTEMLAVALLYLTLDHASIAWDHLIHNLVVE
jgi:hypothetical protein